MTSCHASPAPPAGDAPKTWNSYTGAAIAGRCYREARRTLQIGSAHWTEQELRERTTRLETIRQKARARIAAEVESVKRTRFLVDTARRAIDEQRAIASQLGRVPRGSGYIIGA